MKVFVIGGLGTVGVWVVQRFLDEGHEVVIADVRNDFSLRPSLEGATPFRRIDLLDTAALADAIAADQPECVCLLAAKTSGVPSIEGDPDPYGSFLVNGMGPVSALEATRRAGVARFSYASTKGVYGPMEGRYGPPDYEPVPEDHPRRPHRTSRPYGASKIFAEEAGQYYADRFDVSFRALRFGNIVRPGKTGLGGGGAARFPAIMRAALDGEPLHLTAIAGLKDDVVYVKDVAQGVVLASTVEPVSSWAFNIATGRATTMEDYVAAVKRAVPGADITLDVEQGTDEYRVRCVLDIRRARRELGYEPRYDLDATALDLAAEMRSSGA